MKSNQLKINGTNFNKEGVAAMSKEDFIAVHMAVVDVFPNSLNKEKMLAAAYDEITAKKEKPLSKKEKGDLDSE